jgi:hypothetical protein
MARLGGGGVTGINEGGDWVDEEVWRVEEMVNPNKARPSVLEICPRANWI